MPIEVKCPGADHILQWRQGEGEGDKRDEASSFRRSRSMDQYSVISTGPLCNLPSIDVRQPESRRRRPLDLLGCHLLQAPLVRTDREGVAHRNAAFLVWPPQLGSRGQWRQCQISTFHRRGLGLL